MNRTTEIIHGAFAAPKDDRRGIIRSQSSWFGVDAHEIEGVPHFLDEFVDVHPLLGGDGDGHGDFVAVWMVLSR